MSPLFYDSEFDATAHELIPFPGSPVLGGEATTGGLLLDVGGVDYFVPAEAHEESATFTSDEGMSILADTDGDGRIDYVSTVSFDGQWSAWRWISPAVPPHAGGGGCETPNVGAPEGEIHPEYGEKGWDKDRWVCVERGQWG